MVAFPRTSLGLRLSSESYEHLLQRGVADGVVLNDSVSELQPLHYAEQLRQQNALVIDVVVQKAL